MEGVTGAMWVGMQSLEHAFKNNQRLEIKSRQRSTAQHSSSLIHGPAAAQSVTEQNTLLALTAQQITDLSSRATQSNRLPQPPRGVRPKNQRISAFPGQQCQHRQTKTVDESLIWVTAVDPQKPGCTRSHTVQTAPKVLRIVAKTSQNSLLGKRAVPYSCWEHTDSRPTEVVHLDNGRIKWPQKSDLDLWSSKPKAKCSFSWLQSWQAL